MISGQIDRLRTAAQTYRKMGNHSAESMFLDAADTITELRGALQVASVDYRHLSEENAKLRELCKDMYENSYALSECWECPHCGNRCISNCYYRDQLRELGIEVPE